MIQALAQMSKLKIGTDPGTSAPTQQDIPASNKPAEEQQIKRMEMTRTEAGKQAKKEFIGTSGKSVPASANYLKLNLKEGFGVYQYEVVFKPYVDSEFARFRLVNQIITDYQISKTFDGQILFLPKKICDNDIVFDLKHPFNDSDVTVKIVFKKRVPFDECTTLFNLLFNRVMKVLKYRKVKRQFFDDKHAIPIPQHKLEIWPGYVTIVSECSGGLMLCLDVSHRLLRTMTVYEYMVDTMEEMRTKAKAIIAKTLVGSVVLTQYNNRSYVVHDVVWDINPKSTFKTTNSEVDYLTYYKNQYNIDIKDHDQPMLINRKTVRKNVGGKEKREEQIVVIVPELCYMTGLSDAMRQDFRVMKDVAQYTRISPDVRMNMLRKFVKSIEESKEAQDILNGWGLQIARATIDLKMRVLTPEVILFGDDITVQGTAGADWTGAVMKNPVLSAVDLNKWLILYTAADDRILKGFVDNMLRLAPRMGIQVNHPELYRMPDDRTETYMRILQEKLSDDLLCVVVIAPTIREDRYYAVKRSCCHKVPIASQVINARTLKNPAKQTAIVQKIALQINCKLGGALWTVKFPFKNWMICGIDVYHASAQATGRAVCGFVASMNDSMTRWYSTCEFHKSDREIADHIRVMFVKCLNEYRHQNMDYPTNVIVYRDGVGDGQLNACKEFEIAQIKAVANELNIKLNIVFIVVQKRINARFFSEQRNQYENPVAGSVVDTDITRPYLCDFYLIPQSIRQGTANPTHYIVLENEAQLKADHIQRLSYKLCHMYYNWTGTVRVPAPCQYAHKLAYLVGQHVRAEPSERLNTQLYYL